MSKRTSLIVPRDEVRVTVFLDGFLIAFFIPIGPPTPRIQDVAPPS
jgi:hypothetical protein